jgi:ATP-dependent exoDNAse (exonuclease V) alpha subunit
MSPFHLPHLVAIAMTILKLQGGTIDQVVYDYHKGQEQQMVYVVMSRVRSLDDLYLSNVRNDFNFYHARGSNSENTVRLLSELALLSSHRLNTLSDQLREFLTASTSLRLASINVHSLLAYLRDLDTDCVIAMADLWALHSHW